jgi:4-amino-4-deoxy-L-arabinose transferase-like glycosyltransferase
MVKQAHRHLPALGIIVLYVLVGALFAWRTPDWQAPDEPAHYNYIAQVASGTLLPVIRMGDWDNDYLEQLKANDFAPELLGQLGSVRYENHQPPLYYWLATPFYTLTDGSLLAVRLYSVLLGAISLMLGYAVMLEIFRERRDLAWAALALMAFLPQHVHILSSVNNDALALAVQAGLILLCLRYVRGSLRDPIWIGVGLALVVVTKTTIYFMAAVALVALVLRWRDQRGTGRDLLRALLRVSLPAGSVALLYWGRNLSVYGFPDFLGLRQHDAVVIGQLRSAELIERVGWSGYLNQALTTTFESFWGQFGWMEAPIGDAIPGILSVLVVLVGLALAGLLIGWRQQISHKDSAHLTPLLLLIVILGTLQILYYNLTFVQFQGRYLFTALIPLACALVAGLEVWRGLLLRGAWSVWLVPLACASLALIDLFLIWRVIPGALS